MNKETKIIVGVLAIAGIVAFIAYRRKTGTCCFSNTAAIKDINWEEKKVKIMVKNKPYTYDFSNPNKGMSIPGGWDISHATKNDGKNEAIVLKHDGKPVQIIERV